MSVETNKTNAQAAPQTILKNPELEKTSSKPFKDIFAAIAKKLSLSSRILKN